MQSLFEQGCDVERQGVFEEAQGQGWTDQGDGEETVHRLPDGVDITIGRKERLVAGEALFQPNLMANQPNMFGGNAAGVHLNLYQSILSVDMDMKKSIYQNIVLAGRASLLPGFVERIEYEVTALAPPTIGVKASCVEQRDGPKAAWLGGSILSGSQTFDQMWISKADYEETGPAIVKSKCF